MLKKLMLVCVAVTALLLDCSNSFAQKKAEPWTLEACVDYALKNNIQIKQQVLNAQSTELLLVNSKGNLIPSLNAGVNQNFQWGRAVDKYTNQIYTQQVNSSNMYLSSSVVLFNGMQNINQIKQNKLNLQASVKEVETMQNNISLNVAATYLQILFNLEFLNIAKDQLSITILQVDRTKKLVDAGKVAQGSLYEIQAQKANEELLVVNSQNDLDLSNLNLTQLLDLPSKTGFSVVNPVLNIESKIANSAGLFINPSTVDSIYAIALGNQPSVKSSELYVQMAETGISIAKGYLSPKLNLSLSYGSGYSDARKDYTYQTLNVPAQEIGYVVGTNTKVMSNPYQQTVPIEGNYPFLSQLKDNKSTSVSFGLSIPIFNNYQTQSAIKNAKIGLMRSQNNLQLAKNSIHKDIEDAYSKSVASLNKYKATLESVKSNEEAFAYSQQKYDVGLINTVDYNTAKIKLTKAKSDLLQAKYDFVFRVTVLDFYLGKPLKL